LSVKLILLPPTAEPSEVLVSVAVSAVVPAYVPLAAATDSVVGLTLGVNAKFTFERVAPLLTPVSVSDEAAYPDLDAVSVRFAGPFPLNDSLLAPLNEYVPSAAVVVLKLALQPLVVEQVTVAPPIGAA